MKLFEDRAKAARKHSGLNQSQAGKAIGISREAVSQWENGGTKTINSLHLFPAARAYGVSAEWLATGAGEMLNLDVESLSDSKKAMLKGFDNLNDEDKQTVMITLMGIAASKTQSS